MKHINCILEEHTVCEKEKWNKAQNFELNVWMKSIKRGDDWNRWWANKFDDYSFLNVFKFNSICEVGCGPYANNLKIIMENIKPTYDFIVLLDPLLDRYIEKNYSVNEIINEKTKLYSCAIEEMPTDIRTDLVICINVLDHVYNVEKCMYNIYESLNPGGVFILGQDLTDLDDFKKDDVKNDIGHPIKIHNAYIMKHLEQYKVQIYKKILNRNQGRNPNAHYGTLLYCGQKQ